MFMLFVSFFKFVISCVLFSQINSHLHTSFCICNFALSPQEGSKNCIGLRSHKIWIFFWLARVILMGEEVLINSFQVQWFFMNLH
jgi:hypothetical protein